MKTLFSKIACGVCLIAFVSLSANAVSPSQSGDVARNNSNTRVNSPTNNTSPVKETKEIKSQTGSGETKNFDVEKKIEPIDRKIAVVMWFGGVAIVLLFLCNIANLILPWILRKHIQKRLLYLKLYTHTTRKYLMKKFKTFSVTLDGIKTSVDDIVVKVDGQSKNLTSLKDSFQKQSTDLSRISTNNTAAVATIGELKTKLDALSSEKTSLVKTVSEIKNRLDGELETLWLKNVELSKKEPALEARKRELDRKKEEVQEKEAGLEKRIKETVEVAERTVRSSMQKERDENEGLLRNRIKELEEELSNLTKEKSAWENNFDSAYRKGYNEARNINSMETEKESLAKENGRLTEANKNLAEEKRNLNSKLGEELSKNKKLEDQIKDYDRTNSLLKARQKESDGAIKNLAEEKRNLDSKLNEELSKNKNLEAQKENHAKEISSLKTELKGKEGNIKALTDEKESLDLQLGKERSKNEKLEARAEALVQENSAKEEALRNAEEKIGKLQRVLYPAEYLNDHDFAVLKEHLEGWTSEGFAAAEVVKSALGLFSQRAVLNRETWQQALRNISVGITRVMRDKKQTPDITLKELVLWSKFLMKFSDQDYDFSLRIPNIGDNFDFDWMSSKNAKLIKVNNVLTWAVWSNQFGVMYNAEVE